MWTPFHFPMESSKEDNLFVICVFHVLKSKLPGKLPFQSIGARPDLKQKHPNEGQQNTRIFGLNTLVSKYVELESPKLWYQIIEQMRELACVGV